MKKFRKIVSFALVAVFALSMSFTSNAASRADEYRRPLTAEEIQLISSVFDAQYYGNVYRDVLHAYGYEYYTPAADQALLMHFLAFGIWEERQPSATFNVNVYASRNTDLRAAFGDDIIAYYTYYATHIKEDTWRVVPTFNDAYAKGATIYSVYDLVKGSATEVKPGAYAIQTINDAPNLR